ncbi:MAG: amidase [Bacteroidetes bacterium]|nr:amidase [Bacteroidota bacterium]
MHIHKKYILLLLLVLGTGFLLGYSSRPAAISPEAIAWAEQLIGLNFSPAQRDSMQDDLKEYLQGYQDMRQLELENSLAPSLLFDPRPQGFSMPAEVAHQWQLPKKVALPKKRSELAFYSIPQLAWLLKNQKISSEELTRFYLDRLKKWGPQLECVITLTEERALEKARQADREIAAGKWRGPLHGIPYGAKDLLAVEGYPTTWGATPYKDQTIDQTATVVQQLDEAGAILVAKLTLGALAWGDVWYGGVTKNPWNPKEGSSGSSAGSASAVAAGLVPFAIGTETLGSIVSPSTRCATTGLRPTFGAVSRHGAMALSWTMDKIGPIARSAEDCAIVYQAIRGQDPADPYSIAAPFTYRQRTVKEMRIGYLKDLFARDYPNRKQDSVVLAELRQLGANLQPVQLPDSLPVGSLSIILSAEAAAAFDQLTLSKQDSLLVRQMKAAWPNVFRGARFIPAVEYIQANRMRRLLMEQMHALMKDYDVVVTPSYGGSQLLITNLTGHPAVVMPAGLNKDGTPANVSITFLGNLFDEGAPLELARQYQAATQWNKMQPPGFVD